MGDNTEAPAPAPTIQDRHASILTYAEGLKNEVVRFEQTKAELIREIRTEVVTLLRLIGELLSVRVK